MCQGQRESPTTETIDDPVGALVRMNTEIRLDSESSLLLGTRKRVFWKTGHDAKPVSRVLFSMIFIRIVVRSNVEW